MLFRRPQRRGRTSLQSSKPARSFVVGELLRRACVKRFRITVVFVSAVAVSALAQAPKDLPTAVQAGASKQALEMIRNGADVNQAQGEGSTPLLWAVNRQDYDVAKALLEKMANPNAVNE